MTHPTIRDYHEDRRNHFISPLIDHPNFLGRSALDMRLNKYGPKVNLTKKEDLYEMEVALPGFTKKDIEIIISDNTLTIRAQKNTKENISAKYLIREFDTDIMIRRFTLDKNIGHKKVTAKYRKGILKLTFTNIEERKAVLYKNIEVK